MAEWSIILQLPEEKWPISKDISSVLELPERKTVTNPVCLAMENETLASRINVNRFSKWPLLQHTTARILKLYKQFSKSGKQANSMISPNDLKEAEHFWVKEAQISMHNQRGKTCFKKLLPKYEDGIIVVGGRTERWLDARICCLKSR